MANYRVQTNVDAKMQMLAVRVSEHVCYEAPLNYLFSISWYQEFDFLISRNTFPDIKKCISWYQEFDFLISRNNTHFLISKKSNSWYQETISWYQEFDFLISSNVFWGAVLLFTKYFYIRIWMLDIKKWNSWYQEFDFLISRIWFLNI